MTLPVPQLPRLLHLTDSALPTGAFAYSYGLESSLTFGLIADEAAFRGYLYSCLQQVAGFELPFVAGAAQATAAELETLMSEYDAQLLVPTLHRTSLAQGNSWLRLLSAFYPAAGLAELGAELARRALPTHFAPLFGFTLGRVGFTAAEIQPAFLHLALRDQVSAAIRLGFIGPLAGHRLQHEFYGVFEELLAAVPATYGEALRCTALLDVAQMLHEEVYSRLFQN